MATVLTMEGAFGVGLIVTQLGGTITTGNTVTPVLYNNFGLADANIVDGAEKLDTLIHATAGQKIVFAHSLGAVAATRWLHDYGPTSGITPANLSFVLIGNPARRYGGMLASGSTADFLDSLGQSWGAIDRILAPADTPFQVTDLARQYDGFADYPTDTTNLLAISNAILCTNLIHAYYQFVRLDDPQNLEFVENNITYLLSPTRMFWQPQNTWPKIDAAFNPRHVNLDPGAADPIEWGGTPFEPDRLNDRLWSGDLISRADAAEQLAQHSEAIDPNWFITVYDKMWRPIGAVGDYMEASGTDPRNDLPAATIKLKGNDPLIGTMMSCRDTMVGITVETAGQRFAHYVDTHDYESTQGGEWTGTANCLGVWDVLNYLQIWPDFLLPIQAQVFSHAILIGPLVTVLENMIAECALRIQSGLWEFVNNALSLNPDIRAWFGTLLQSNGNILEMLKTPIYVVRTNPFLDGSPLVARTVRMESCATVLKDLTKAFGVDVRVDLWLPGDDQPDEWTKAFDFLALDQPTYVVTVKDRSQISGPTYTPLDSVIGAAVDLGGSFGLEIAGLIETVPGMEGVFYSPLLGQHYVAPWAILVAPEPGEKGSVDTCKITDHTPKGWQHIIGGRSPKWLNDLMNATFAWIIDSISILIGVIGIPSNLLEGFLNNAFLAFQLVELYDRRDKVGPYHPAIEVFHPTSSAPYNVETLFAFINAIWDSRGWTAAQCTFRNGVVYALGKDIFRGGLASLVYMGRTKLYTDYVENVAWRIDENTRDIFLQLGDGKAQEAPLAKHQRFLSGVLESINVLTLSPQSAGLA